MFLETEEVQLIGQETRLVRNKLIKTLDVVGKEYNVQFQVKLMSATFGSVVRFTIAEGYNYGDGGPTIYFHNAGIRTFTFYTFINQRQTLINTAAYPLNTWITIEVKQILEGGQYKRIITVNNQVLSSVINNQPVEKRHVKVYAGGASHSAAHGYIRNLIFHNYPRKGMASFLYCYRHFSQ